MLRRSAARASPNWTTPLGAPASSPKAPTGLTPHTGYSFVAFATNIFGTTYTSPVSTFSTIAIAPTVTNPTEAGITSTAATLGGDAASDGGATITTRGVLYALTSSNPNPTIGAAGVTELNDPAGGTGVFTESANGLTPVASYSFVAFATNSVGTTYTSPVSTFTTLGRPTVTNPTETGITTTSTTATLGGDAVSGGGAAITTRGVLYALTSANPNPTIGGAGVTELNDPAGGIGVFTESASGLTPGASYSFVAFATNSVGTTYTSPVSTFGPPTVTLNPTSQTVGAGGSISMTAAATNGGSSLATVQWQVSTNGGATFSNLSNGGVYSGTNTTTLSISGPTTPYTGFQYQAVFSNAAGQTPRHDDGRHHDGCIAIRELSI